MQNGTNPPITPGLEGVIAAETRLSSVNGQIGELIIAGFAVEELANKATFEETAYLLWYGRLPNPAELIDFKARLVTLRSLPPTTLQLLKVVATEKISAMDALRMAAGTLNVGLSNSHEEAALALTARFPTIVAAYWRLLHRQEAIEPDPTLYHAANYLTMLNAKRPSAAQVRGLETYLNTVVDHGLNASTFAARVIISTQSDMVSAVVGVKNRQNG